MASTCLSTPEKKKTRYREVSSMCLGSEYRSKACHTVKNAVERPLPHASKHASFE